MSCSRRERSGPSPVRTSVRFFVFKQKTAYEIHRCWSSDVCSSDLPERWTVEAARQFVDEARILANLRHPNIVPVHKVDERDGLNFYVMDYLEGDTLQTQLEKQIGRASCRERV